MRSIFKTTQHNYAETKVLKQVLNYLSFKDIIDVGGIGVSFYFDAFALNREKRILQLVQPY